MNQPPVKTEILGLERRYWDAMKRNDVEAGVALTKFPCMMTSPKGVQKISEEQYRKIMESANTDVYEGVEIQHPQVEILSPDVAMISYSTEVQGMKMVDVSTWVRQGDKWVCAFHSENPLS